MFKKLIHFVGFLLVCVSIYYLGRIFFENSDVLRGIEFSPKNVIILLFSLALYLSNYLLFSFAWLLQVREKYPFFSYKNSVFIIGRSQIGKYLPGNVAHFVGRLVLLPKGVNKIDITYTMFVENIVMLSTSSTIGFFYIFYFDFLTVPALERTLIILGILVAIGLVSHFGLRFIRKRIDFLKIQNETLAKLLVLSVASSFIGGAVIYLLVELFGEIYTASYLQCVTGFALAFIVGFITPGAPGGLGIREFTFVLLFGKFVTDVVALEIILTFRIISLVGDILLLSLTKLLKTDWSVPG